MYIYRFSLRSGSSQKLKNVLPFQFSMKWSFFVKKQEKTLTEQFLCVFDLFTRHDALNEKKIRENNFQFYLSTSFFYSIGMQSIQGNVSRSNDDLNSN